MTVLYIKVREESSKNKEEKSNNKKEKSISVAMDNNNVENKNNVTNQFHKVINTLRKVFKTVFYIVDLEEVFNGYIASVPINRKKEVQKRKVGKINKNAVTFKDCALNKDNIVFKRGISIFKKFISDKILQMRNCIIARKIRRIVNEKNIDGIVLSDDIRKNTDFLDKLIIRKKQRTVKSSEKNLKKTEFIENLNYTTNSIIKAKSFIKERQIFFFDGNGLFKYIIYEILMYIINIQNRKPELEDIYIIANILDEAMLGNIILLSTKFRNVNIVSKNIGKYDYLEALVYNNTGNSVILLNNKRKSLKRAKYIINVDNSIKELNEYLIYRKAIIINMQLETKKQETWKEINKTSEQAKKSNKMQEKAKKQTSSQIIAKEKKSNIMLLTGFEGILINSFEIDLNDKIKQFFKKYGLINIASMSILYESFLNRKENFENIREKIEDAGLVVKKLYGNNGIIDENEYKRVNLSDNEAKKYY